MDSSTELLLRRRMYGLYLTRPCESLDALSRALLGLHCWFHRNVVFSAALRGASLSGWQTALTKTWLYRGTLHGAAYDELPLLLALHAQEAPWEWIGLDRPTLERVAEQVVSLMEDGVYSRAEMRSIFAHRFDPETVRRLFSPWGGIFVYLARRGRVAFRSMTSRDFDLISAEPTLTPEEALPALLARYFTAYGPATLADAAWFFGLPVKMLAGQDLQAFSCFEYQGKPCYYAGADPRDTPDLPEVALLSGFDPCLVSYTGRTAVLPPAYQKSVILKSGICLPTVAVRGQVAGIWNLKRGAVTLEFFSPQPAAIRAAAADQLEALRWRTAGKI